MERVLLGVRVKVWSIKYVILYSVNHRILIVRLNSLGFSNDCLAWFTNYFADRIQCVKSEGMLSGHLAASMGVPQGSILGPTLFTVYIKSNLFI
jgi:hypothetical protein